MLARALLLLIATLWSVWSLECYKKDSCSCVTNTRQEIDLSPFRGTFFVSQEEKNGTKMVYRYYPCGIVADWGTCTVKERTSVCLRETTSERVTYATIATQDTVRYNVVLTEPYVTEIIYRNGTETTTIRLKCTSGIETQADTFIRLASSTSRHLRFMLTSKHGCPIQLAPKYHNPPVLFILLCVLGGVTLLVYFTGGMTYQFCVKGAKGLEIVPHVDFWRETPSLFRDGFIFVFSCYRPFQQQLSHVI